MKYNSSVSLNKYHVIADYQHRGEMFKCSFSFSFSGCICFNGRNKIGLDIYWAVKAIVVYGG